VYCAHSLINIATCHGMSNPELSPSPYPIKGEGTISFFYLFFPRPFVGEGQSEQQ
jgi:hypothetical protein